MTHSPARRGGGALEYQIQRFPSLPSTQTEAREMAEHGAPEGVVVLAAEQTAGRGRLGSSFFSPLGGLYCSLVLRPPLAPSLAPLLGLAGGLALAEAVRDVSELRPVLKWPNDLLLRDRKLSGLLVDLSAHRETIHYAVLGVGVNVDVSPWALPVDLRERATSLSAELGRAVSSERLLVRFLAHFRAQYAQLLAPDGPAAVVSAWRAWPNLLGQRVSVLDREGEWEGLAQDLDGDGALLVRVASGQTRRVIAGEVHLRSLWLDAQGSGQEPRQR